MLRPREKRTRPAFLPVEYAAPRRYASRPAFPADPFRPGLKEETR